MAAEQEIIENVGELPHLHNQFLRATAISKAAVPLDTAMPNFLFTMPQNFLQILKHKDS